MKRYFILLLMLLVVSSAAFAAVNTSNVNQSGDNNAAGVTQTGANYSEVDQTGDNHTATIDQVGNSYRPYPGSWLYMGADVDQYGGDGNEAHISASNGPHEARIDQDGNSNLATQSLGATAHYTNNPSRLGLHIKQAGDGNEAHQATSPSFGCYGVKGMLIDQLGDSNFADQYSKGGMASVIEIFHDGDGNSSTQTQWARFSDAHVDITGDNNTTVQDQTYTVWSISGDEDALIDIVGDGNSASQLQLGEYNFADIDISGDSNISSTSQIGGDLNTAVINISSNGNTAMINQNGMSNNTQVLNVP